MYQLLYAIFIIYRMLLLEIHLGKISLLLSEMDKIQERADEKTYTTVENDKKLDNETIR